MQHCLCYLYNLCGWTHRREYLQNLQTIYMLFFCQDPTAGPSASDQSTWYLDEFTLSDNIKKTLHKFCGPSPVVFR